MIYAVCSLLDDEGADAIDAFLLANPSIQSVPLGVNVGREHGAGRLLTPYFDGSDGFFLARMQKL
jgi:16S rRNA (cytosine967-C5)-methyltransferase